MARHGSVPPGGSGGPEGGPLADPHHSRADAAMIRKAIKDRWPVPEGMRETLVRRLADTALKGCE